MRKSAREIHAARIGLVSDHLFPLAHGGAERVYRVLADSLVAEHAQLTYFTRTQWSDGQNLETAFDVEAVWSGAVYDENGTRRIGAALAWTGALIRKLWQLRVDVLIVSATPVFNVFAGLIAKIRHPSTVLIVDWLEIWPWNKWISYSGTIAGTIAWVLQSIAMRIGNARLVNSKTTLDRLPIHAQETTFLLPLVSLAGPPLPLQKKNPDTLLFVGRHIPDKNLPMLPRVLFELKGEFPELRAIVIGDGPDRENAMSIAIELGVEDRIDFCGRVDDDVLVQHLETAGALFFPSVREGFGLVVCEAARFGTPSIVVDHPDNAAAKLVTEGLNGSVANALNVEQLVDATRRVIQGGVELQNRTKDWYDLELERSGGFEKVARQIVGLSKRGRSTLQ